MKDLVLYDVKKKDGKFWKLAIIKSLESNGRVAISKTEPIGPKDLYYRQVQRTCDCVGETMYADIETPGENDYKVISVAQWFQHITRKVGAKILIEVEPYEDSSEFKIVYPVNIKIKETKKEKKKRKKLAQ